MCILVPALLWHLICTNFLVLFRTYLYYILCKFSIIIKRIDDGTAPSKYAIWDEFNEQHQHQSIKKHHIYCLISTFWSKQGADSMHILFRYKVYQHFSRIFLKAVCIKWTNCIKSLFYSNFHNMSPWSRNPIIRNVVMIFFTVAVTFEVWSVEKG